MDIIAQYGTVFLILAAVFGLFMAWGIGANEFAGAILAGGQVTKTIRKGIVDADLLSANPELLLYGMLASLLAAGVWLLIASKNGWPVSTTHSIVGAIVGFAMVGIGMEAVHWNKVGFIVASWVVSPVLAGLISFMLFRSVLKLILNTENPYDNAKKYVPYYMFLVGFIIALVTLVKGLKHVGLELSTIEQYGYAILIGAVIMIAGKLYINTIKHDPKADKHFHFTNVERIFGVLMVLTACAMAFAHGSNDVANAIGPVAAVVSIVQSGGEVASQSALPLWVLGLGGVGIVIGLMMYGKKVIETVGHQITELTPSRGFAATLAAATTVVLASGTGLPISTTHTLVGAILGVGLARGMAALNMTVIRNIFMSWIVTLPAGALLSILFFFTLKGIFS
jgi:PiT family inorganic phosphate transporter